MVSCASSHACSLGTVSEKPARGALLRLRTAHWDRTASNADLLQHYSILAPGRPPIAGQLPGW